MASNSNTVQMQEIRELHNRVEWLDGERRNLARKLTELEQQISLKDREIEGREQRIQELESRLSSTSVQLSRLSHLDVQLSQFKDEVVQMIEQYDQRRIRSEKEIDRLRRVEHEVIAREMADVRKELPAIGRLQDEMELRLAEESRLAKLIGEQQNRIKGLENLVESREGAISFLEEKEKRNGRSVAEALTAILEINKRGEHFRDRLELVSANVARIESSQQTVAEDQAKIRESLQSWMEQIQVGEYERNQKVESWQRVLVEHEERMERFGEEWILFSDQYKEAKMAVQSLSEWQKQLEQQQRESSELLRIETHRMESRLDGFQQDNENKWKNFTVESEQRWSTVNRQDKQFEEELTALEETLTKLAQELDLLRRVQSAQTDAIKRLPLMWMEEVERAIAQNPNRRRQPALVPVREE